MQVENPEDIKSEGGKSNNDGHHKKKTYYITPLIVLCAILFYFFGPDFQTIRGFLGTEKALEKITVITPEEKSVDTIYNPSTKPLIEKVYKDEICNNITRDTRKPLTFDGKEGTIHAFLACSEEDRILGVGAFQYIAPDDGLLFVFEKPGKYKFWMNDIGFYLTAAFIDENNTIIDIIDLEPLSIDLVGPDNSNTKYVLEVNRGWFKKHNIQIGDKIIFN